MASTRHNFEVVVKPTVEVHPDNPNQSIITAYPEIRYGRGGAGGVERSWSLLGLIALVIASVALVGLIVYFVIDMTRMSNTRDMISAAETRAYDNDQLILKDALKNDDEVETRLTAHDDIIIKGHNNLSKRMDDNEAAVKVAMEKAKSAARSAWLARQEAKASQTTANEAVKSLDDFGSLELSGPGLVVKGGGSLIETACVLKDADGKCTRVSVHFGDNQ